MRFTGEVHGEVHGRIAGHHDCLRRGSARARALAVATEAVHVEGMRGFAVLASVVLPAVLIACTEPVGPNVASAPAFYEPGFGPWWPYCCTAVLVGPVTFRHFHHFHQFPHFHHHHHGGGGHHGGGHHGGGHR